MSQFIRFMLVGASAALMYIALAFVLTSQAALPTWLAGTLAYACMILPAYLAQRALAFRAKTDHGIALPRYLLLQAVCATISAPLTIIIERVTAYPPLVTFTIVAILLACFSFALSRQWVFALRARATPNSSPPQ